RAGRDSSRVMLTPEFEKDAISSSSDPGRLWVVMTIDVLSLPEGPASCAPSTRKRVRFFASSSMDRARSFSPYRAGALSGPIAAALASFAAPLAASALLADGMRCAPGRCCDSQPLHCASDCGCE